MPAPVSAGVMSTLSSRRIISPAMPITSTDSAFCIRRPSVCARLVRSMTSRPVPRLISCSKRRVAAEPMRMTKYAAIAMMTMRRPASRNQRNSASGLPPKSMRYPASFNDGGRSVDTATMKTRSLTMRRGRSTNCFWTSRSSMMAWRMDCARRDTNSAKRYDRTSASASASMTRGQFGGTFTVRWRERSEFSAARGGRREARRRWPCCRSAHPARAAAGYRRRQSRCR